MAKGRAKEKTAKVAKKATKASPRPRKASVLDLGMSKAIALPKKKARNSFGRRTILKVKWRPGDDDRIKCEAENGSLLRLAEICEAMMADSVIAGLLDTRSNGLISLPVSITGKDDRLVRILVGDSDGGQLQKNSALFWKMFPTTELARVIKWGILAGMGLGEFVEDANGVPVLHALDLHDVTVDFDGRLWWTAQGVHEEIIPGNGRWFCWFPEGRDRFWVWGAWYGLASHWIAKTHAIIQRRAWGAKLAGGVLWVTSPTSSTDRQRDKMRDHLVSAINPVAVNVTGWTLDWKESNGRGYEVWSDAQKDADTQIAIRLTGSTVLAFGTTGFSSGNIHQAVTLTFIQSNAETLAEAVHYQGLVPWAQRLGGMAPWAEWDTTPPEDRQALATAVKAFCEAVQASGQGWGNVQLDVEQFAYQMGIPVNIKKPEPAPTAGPIDPLPILEGMAGGNQQ